MTSNTSKISIGLIQLTSNDDLNQNIRIIEQYIEKINTMLC